MLADYHVHSEFSDDSEYPMKQVVEDAIALGLDEICFTDHVDYGIKKDVDEPGEVVYHPGGPGEPAMMALLNPDYPVYYKTVTALQSLYRRKPSRGTGSCSHVIRLILFFCRFIRLRTKNFGRGSFNRDAHGMNTYCAIIRKFSNWSLSTRITACWDIWI